MFVVNGLLRVAGYGTHPEATKLEKNLSSIQKLPTLEKRSKVRLYIQAAVTALKASNPEAFTEAVEYGTGPFIHLMEATHAAGFKEKMLFTNSFDPATAKGVSTTKDGHYVTTETQEALVFASEFPAYFSALMAAYPKTFEMFPLTKATDAIAVVANSRVHVSARFMVYNFCWDCRELLKSPNGYNKNKKRIDWLVARGIKALQQYQDAGNMLPGKSIHGADALENTVENMSESLKHSTATNANLSNTAAVLSHNNASLTDSVQKLTTSNHELTKEKEELAQKNQQLQAMLAAAAPNVAAVAVPPQVPTAPRAATPTPKKRAAAKRSAPAPALTSFNKRVPSSRSAKKARKKTTADVFEDGEDVQVAENYSVKKWRGKSGFVELSSSTDSKVMVTFPDGSCKLIDCEFVESLCH